MSLAACGRGAAASPSGRVNVADLNQRGDASGRGNGADPNRRGADRALAIR